jgi:zinc protease
MNELSDSELWQKVLSLDRQAFEVIVARHQSAVSAVAYSVCGDFAQSEDIAQDAFLTAWNDRESLQSPMLLRSWLCGIARNKARNVRRSEGRYVTNEDDFSSLSSEHQPIDMVVSHEESALVRQALEELPESYREPLILFYREDQSVAEVARSLDLSESAVKQRLARGREMLREQMLSVVERSLRATRPTSSFTARVMAALGFIGLSAKSASAAVMMSTAKPAASAVASSTALGVASGVGGAAIGVMGGYMGSWIPAQLAPTKTERDELLRSGRRMLVVSIVASILLFVVFFFSAGKTPWWVSLAITLTWIFAFMTYCFAASFATARRVQRIRQTVKPEDDPNPSKARQFMNARMQQRGKAVRWIGRRYRSSASFLGWPLLDIQVSDPWVHGEPVERKQARGWIAIGDSATGFLAIGGISRGVISFGGASAGLFSMGGLSAGLVSFGGLAVGGLAIGGLGLGWLGVGGLSAGYNALGGGAIAWNDAVGGAAVAYHAAFGGGALAHEIAMGGSAIASNANNEVAKSYFESHWMVQSMEWAVKNRSAFLVSIVVLSILPSLIVAAVASIIYLRVPIDERDE